MFASARLKENLCKHSTPFATKLPTFSLLVGSVAALRMTATSGCQNDCEERGTRCRGCQLRRLKTYTLRVHLANQKRVCAIPIGDGEVGVFSGWRHVATLFLWFVLLIPPTPPSLLWKTIFFFSETFTLSAVLKINCGKSLFLLDFSFHIQVQR